MKRTLLFSLALAIAPFSSIFSQSDTDPIKALSLVIEKIDSYPSMEYTAYQAFEEAGMTLPDTFLARMFRSDSSDGIPFQYALENASGHKQSFDGHGQKTYLPEERVIIDDPQPHPLMLLSNQHLMNSPYYLGLLLSTILQEQPAHVEFLGDTLLGSTKAAAYAVRMDYQLLVNGEILREGDRLPNGIIAEKISVKYRLLMDLESHLPLGLMQTYEDNSIQSVTFGPIRRLESSFEEVDQALAEGTSGYLTMSPREFAQIQMANQQQIMGTQAKDFSLKELSGDTLSLSQLAGSPVLLEFWFPNCGSCLRAIPHVNQLHQDFAPKGLHVLSVEFANGTDEYLSIFREKHQIVYPILTQGKQLSLAYGIQGGPSFVLLNKEHQVVYVSKDGLDKEALLEAIQSVL